MSATKRSLRRFNDVGMRAFAQWLGGGDATNPPIAYLDDSTLSDEWRGGADVEVRKFSSKLDLGAHLHAALGADWEEALDDAGLLAWLSLAFHESTMMNAAGKPYLGQASRHLVATDNQWKSYTHSHRHLVRSAIFFFGKFGELARVFLAGHPSEHSKIEEQIGSRKTEGLPFSRPIAEAVSKLYFDPVTGKIQRGAASNRGGAIERFVKVTRQFDLTFDVQGLSGKELVSLLPKEFERFLGKSKPGTA